VTRLYDDLAGVVARDGWRGHGAVERGDDPLTGLLLAQYQQLGLCAWMATSLTCFTCCWAA
jgi:hypothetical protein